MSVYSMYFGGLTTAKNYASFGGKPIIHNEFQRVKEMLEATPHTLIFIITTNQWEAWKETVKTYNLEQFEIFEMPYFVTNPNTPEYGRRLRLVILKGTGSDES